MDKDINRINVVLAEKGGDARMFAGYIIGIGYAPYYKRTLIDNELGNRYHWRNVKQTLNTYQKNFAELHLDDYRKTLSFSNQVYITTNH